MDLLGTNFLFFGFSIYVLSLIVFFYISIRYYVMAIFALFYYKKGYDSIKYPKNHAIITDFKKKPKTDYPFVTVQLPMFNELYVVDRVIDATVKLKYPKDKFEIQVLDDSIDETQKIAQEKVKYWKKKGFDVTYIHRTNRKGYKAGALAEALECAKGEFIAIFDADTVPNPNFLMVTVPFLIEDPKLSFVQTRLKHLNSNESYLTELQSTIIDCYFIIDRLFNSNFSRWQTFDGTGGLLRKVAIKDSGGWEEDTLAEDTDMSFRMLLKGWKAKFLHDFTNDEELPNTFVAYKSQQFRWTKGLFQTGIKLLKKILTSNARKRTKWAIVNHLIQASFYFAMFINILFVPFTIMILAKYPITSLTWNLIFFVAFTLSTIAPIFMIFVGQYILHGRLYFWRKIKLVPLFFFMATAVMLNNAKAMYEAIRGKESEFRRTPKYGAIKKKKIMIAQKYTVSSINKLTVSELLLSLYALGTLFLAIQCQIYLMLPFLFLYFCGLLYAGFIEIKAYFMKKVLLRLKV